MSEFSIAQSATPQETAAIAAAVQRFTADTAVAAPAGPAGMDPWLKAALQEGVSAKDVFGPGEPFGTF